MNSNKNGKLPEDEHLVGEWYEQVVLPYNLSLGLEPGSITVEETLKMYYTQLNQGKSPEEIVLDLSILDR